MDGHLLAHAGDAGSTSGPSRSHLLPGTKPAGAPQLLSLLQLLKPKHLKPTFCSQSSHHKEESPLTRSPQLEKARRQQPGPSTA